MWIIGAAALGLLAVPGKIGSRIAEPANPSSLAACRYWLDHLPKVARASTVSNTPKPTLGRAMLVIHVEQLDGKQIGDDVYMTIGVGSEEPIKAAIVGNKAFFRISWGELPASQNVRVNICAHADLGPGPAGAWSSEALSVTASIHREAAPRVEHSLLSFAPSNQEPGALLDRLGRIVEGQVFSQCGDSPEAPGTFHGGHPHSALQRSVRTWHEVVYDEQFTIQAFPLAGASPEARTVLLFSSASISPFPEIGSTLTLCPSATDRALTVTPLSSQCQDSGGTGFAATFIRNDLFGANCNPTPSSGTNEPRYQHLRPDIDMPNPLWPVENTADPVVRLFMPSKQDTATSPLFVKLWWGLGD